MSKIYVFAYFALVVFHLYLSMINEVTFRSISKCLLMPGLILLYMQLTKISKQKDKKKRSKLLIAGMTFGSIGDIVLLFSHIDICFKVGLVLFLFGHISYITQFFRITLRNKYNLLFLAILQILHYLFYIFIIFLPDLQTFLSIEMKVAVLGYGLFLATLNGFGIYFFLCKPCVNTILQVIGTINFCISDIVLVKNTYLKPQTYGNFLVMATYLAAQIGIAVANGL